MTSEQQPEVWMRGPVPGVPALLQPVAHALLQAKEEATLHLEHFDHQFLWRKPGGVASVGFHLQHMVGVIDRMLAYAADQPLTEAQFAYLRSEETAVPDLTIDDLITALGRQVDAAVSALRETDEATLTDTCYLGRKRIPTTRIGLLFHAAEHTQRHLGQLLVTARIQEQAR